MNGLKVELEEGLSQFKKVLDAWISSLGLDKDQALRLKARFDEILSDYEKQVTNMEINLVELDKLYKVSCISIVFLHSTGINNDSVN